MSSKLLLAVLLPAAALSQDAAPSDGLTFFRTIRDRVENWHWFTPASANNKYTFNGTTLRFGVSQQRESLDWMTEFELPILANLPANAVAPGTQGQLGLGANYYVANKASNVAMIFPKQIFVRFHNAFGLSNGTLQLGRFEFFDGAEVKSKDPTVAAVKRDRIQQRLIGTFSYSDVLRAFDGFHYSYDRNDTNYTWVSAVPTRGVFQVDGWGWNDIAFSYGSAIHQVHSKSSNGEVRFFAIYYDDFRHITKTDNRSAAVRATDHNNIRIWTLGSHFVDALTSAAGTFDVMAEGAVQFGDWGVEQQRAAMADVEAGYQPNILPSVKPWIRIGYYYGSGDRNPNDNTHGTFFQLMPTARAYARFPFFDMENNVDRFAMITLRPHKRVAIHSEAHSLSLASGADLWYSGGGAFQPWSFGYQGRAANGSTSLANLYDVNVDFTVTQHFTVTPYLGYAQGKSVIQYIYPKGKDGHLAFLEATYRF